MIRCFTFRNKYYIPLVWSGLFLFIFLCSIDRSYSQTYTSSVSMSASISEIVKVDVEPSSTPINFIFSSPVEAGSPFTEISDNSHWLNYSVCLADNTSDQTITASSNINSAYPGFALTLTASQYSGIGSGTHGTTAGAVTLSATDQVIINSIRGSYTGNGTTNGHQLTYELSISDYSLIDLDTSSEINVTFTISN